MWRKEFPWMKKSGNVCAHEKNSKLDTLWFVGSQEPIVIRHKTVLSWPRSQSLPCSRSFLPLLSSLSLCEETRVYFQSFPLPSDKASEASMFRTRDGTGLKESRTRNSRAKPDFTSLEELDPPTPPPHLTPPIIPFVLTLPLVIALVSVVFVWGLPYTERWHCDSCSLYRIRRGWFWH